MCGIAGYLGVANIDKLKLKAASKSLNHRGPDGEGLYTSQGINGNKIALIHRRLSIIDLNERSNQPFRVGDKVLVMNGEIYNYIELRRELKALGHNFNTDGDTEVLAKALYEWGTNAQERLEGMWAFALYDESNGELLLSRDRSGQKPLYYYESSNTLYFASEPKAIFAQLGEILPINQNQLKRFLVNGYKSLYKSNETFFDGLREITPGTFRIYGGRINREEHYSQSNFNQQDINLTYAEAIEEVRSALISSIELHLRSDVPIAFCLSGGVDSNALISLATNQFNYDVHGFTIINTDERYEEKDLIDNSVQKMGLRHTKVSLNTYGFLDNLRKLIKAHDAPVYTITYYAHWILMKAIREAGYKVSISGTGADELFSGYYDHHLAYLAVLKSKNTTRYNEALSEWQTHVKPMVRNPYLQDPEYLSRAPNRRDHIFMDSEFFSRILQEPFKEEFTEVSYCDDLLRNRMANELKHEVVPVLLHEDDRNAMFYSIENRSPYLDHNLFSVCQKIPTEYLIQNGRAKSVLREAIRGIAPNAIVDNPRKVGFNIPLYDCLNIEDNSDKEQLLSNSPIFELVNREAIEQMLSKKQLSNSRSKFLFNFISAKIFLEEFS